MIENSINKFILFAGLLICYFVYLILAMRMVKKARRLKDENNEFDNKT